MPAPRQSCSVFLPTAAQLFFRLMLQIGVPAAAITEDSCNDGLWQDGGERASDGNAGGMERRLWELLPEPCRQLSLLWKGESAGSGRQRKPLSSLSFAVSSSCPLYMMISATIFIPDLSVAIVLSAFLRLLVLLPNLGALPMLLDLINWPSASRPVQDNATRLKRTPSP